MRAYLSLSRGSRMRCRCDRAHSTVSVRFQIVALPVVCARCSRKTIACALTRDIAPRKLADAFCLISDPFSAHTHASPFQIENQPDGVRLLHILGIEYRHSGEIKCTATQHSSSSAALVAYADLVVLPATSADTRIARSFVDEDAAQFRAHRRHHQSKRDRNDAAERRDNDDNDDDDEGVQLISDLPPRRPLLVAHPPPRIVKGPADCVALVGGTVTLCVEYESAADNDRPPPTVVKWLLAVRTSIY